MMKYIPILSLASLAQISYTSAFAPQWNTSCRNPTSVQMLPLGTEDSQHIISSFQSSSNILSTISADIDNIPTNEFATVFAGGIGVMIGSVIAVLIVGFILESGNSYANIVADSYAQGGDEAFWASLSEEDKEKAQEMVSKLRKSKEGVGSDNNASMQKEVTTVTAKKEEVAMFSDYED
jgi:hypothetical protein